MEKYLSSGGDKSSKNYSSKIFNNSKEKNKKSKSKPKSEAIIGNKIFFNTNNKSNIKNIDNNSLYDIQDNLFIPKIVYSNNILGEKNKYNNIRLNSRGEVINNNVKNNQEDESLLAKYKEKINLKDLKINELEKKIEFLSNEFYNFKKYIKYNIENNIEIKKEKPIEKNIIEQEIPKYMDIKINNSNLDFNSNVIKERYEKEMILNQISKNIKSIKLLFTSEISGTDTFELKNAYLNKSNLIFAIKTTKGKRFGAYCYEVFENRLFNKCDRYAFLYSLDNMKIMKSKKSQFDIWKQSDDSIDFGSGTDLRIFYDFYTNKNYAYNGVNSYDYKNCCEYALNGEKFFSVNILEIFQVYI